MAKTPTRRPRRHLAAAKVESAKVRKRIRQVREAQGLAGNEIASKMGISRPFYTQLENGTRRVDLVYFLAICQALRVEPGELLE